MRRKHLKRIQIWQNSAVSDGFSGNTLTESQLGSAWADIQTLSEDREDRFGLDNDKAGIVFKVRTRNDIDYFTDGLFVKWDSRTWIPFRVRKLDYDNQKIEISCQSL